MIKYACIFPLFYSHSSDIIPTEKYIIGLGFPLYFCDLKFVSYKFFNQGSYLSNLLKISPIFFLQGYPLQFTLIEVSCDRAICNTGSNRNSASLIKKQDDS